MTLVICAGCRPGHAPFHALDTAKVKMSCARKLAVSYVALSCLRRQSFLHDRSGKIFQAQPTHGARNAHPTLASRGQL